MDEDEAEDVLSICKGMPRSLRSKQQILELSV